uniref:Uncharacterized protein n=1 Tax=Anguilla anguilla TaxID=7936 RepID=A0A0E9WCA6_ANGAN
MTTKLWLQTLEGVSICCSVLALVLNNTKHNEPFIK